MPQRIQNPLLNENSLANLAGFAFGQSRPVARRLNRRQDLLGMRLPRVPSRARIRHIAANALARFGAVPRAGRIAVVDIILIIMSQPIYIRVRTQLARPFPCAGHIVLAAVMRLNLRKINLMPVAVIVMSVVVAAKVRVEPAFRKLSQMLFEAAFVQRQRAARPNQRRKQRKNQNHAQFSLHDRFPPCFHFHNKIAGTGRSPMRSDSSQFQKGRQTKAQAAVSPTHLRSPSFTAFAWHSSLSLL